MGMFNPDWFGHAREVFCEHGGVDTPLPAGPPQGEGPWASSCDGRDTVWVVYASQTGVAEQLARQASRGLQAQGVESRLLAFDELELATLEQVRRVLFLASTSYDGEPPDMAEAFVRACMQAPAALSRLRYGMLALGDSYYDEYCAFGRRLEQWLRDSGAQPLFQTIEMDDEDAAALQRWQQQLATLAWLRHNEARACR
jgi:sulfite reductase (NADPH) flavoprotein alpha-component